MQKKVRVLRKKPREEVLVYHEVETPIQPEIQQIIPEKEIQEEIVPENVKIKMEPLDEETLESLDNFAGNQIISGQNQLIPENFVIKTEPMDDLPEESEHYDNENENEIPINFHIKSEPEFYQYEEDYPENWQENNAEETALESTIEIKMECPDPEYPTDIDYT
jgi:hypothetical protein